MICNDHQIHYENETIKTEDLKKNDLRLKWNFQFSSTADKNKED